MAGLLVVCAVRDGNVRKMGDQAVVQAAESMMERGWSL
jgi:hypothetical protein